METGGRESGKKSGSLTGSPRIDQVIDLLCARGCRAVTACIDLLEQGVEETAWAHLDASERARLLEELRAIMAVYGGRCRVDS